MKSLQHSAVNYCLGIEGRLQILFRLMKHESAASHCKEELNILRATADTLNLQSLCFYTGLNISTWNQTSRDALQNCERLLIAGRSLNWSSFHRTQGGLLEILQCPGQDTVRVTVLTCAVWRSKRCGLSALNPDSSTRTLLKLLLHSVCSYGGGWPTIRRSTRWSNDFGSPLLTHSFLG